MVPGRLEFLASQVVEGFITGLHKSPFHGFSVEFAEHRLYNTGESTRHIDWKLYARTEKLFVKRYEEETNLRCQMVLDRSSSMYYPQDKKKINKLEFSVLCAASLIQLLRRQRDAVGLSLFNDRVEQHTRAQSNSMHHRFLMNEMERILHSYDKSSPRKTSAAESLHEIADRCPRRSLVVIFSDMFDSTADNEELFGALQHLRHNKHEVVLFHVTDRSSELELDLGNQPYDFEDMETGEKVRLNPIHVQKAYKKELEAFYADLKLRCGQYRIDFVEADIAGGFEPVLIQFLVKRQKMH